MPLLRTASFLALVCLTACQHSERQCQVAQEPEPVVETPVEATEQPSDMTTVDLGVPPEQFPEEGAKLLSDEKSVGRFPTGLAVAQVYASVEPGTKGSILPAESTEARRALWNDMLTDLPTLREVRVLRATSLDPRGFHCRDLLCRAVTDHCNLCLIFTRSGPSEFDAEYIGTLWDAPASKPLAVFRTPVIVFDFAREVSDCDHHGKHRHSAPEEADLRAESELRHLVRDTIWDLAARDQTRPTTEPSPWQSDHPLIPRDPRLRLFEFTPRKGR